MRIIIVLSAFALFGQSLVAEVNYANETQAIKERILLENQVLLLNKIVTLSKILHGDYPLIWKNEATGKLVNSGKEYTGALSENLALAVRQYENSQKLSTQDQADKYRTLEVVRNFIDGVGQIYLEKDAIEPLQTENDRIYVQEKLNDLKSAAQTLALVRSLIVEMTNANNQDLNAEFPKWLYQNPYNLNYLNEKRFTTLNPENSRGLLAHAYQIANAFWMQTLLLKSTVGNANVDAEQSLEKLTTELSNLYLVFCHYKYYVQTAKEESQRTNQNIPDSTYFVRDFDEVYSNRMIGAFQKAQDASGTLIHELSQRAKNNEDLSRQVQTLSVLYYSLHSVLFTIQQSNKFPIPDLGRKIPRPSYEEKNDQYYELVHSIPTGPVISTQSQPNIGSINQGTQPLLNNNYQGMPQQNLPGFNLPQRLPPQNFTPPQFQPNQGIRQQIVFPTPVQPVQAVQPVQPQFNRPVPPPPAPGNTDPAPTVNESPATNSEGMGPRIIVPPPVSTRTSPPLTPLPTP